MSRKKLNLSSLPARVTRVMKERDAFEAQLAEKLTRDPQAVAKIVATLAASARFESVRATLKERADAIQEVRIQRLEDALLGFEQLIAKLRKGA